MYKYYKKDEKGLTHSKIEGRLLVHFCTLIMMAGAVPLQSLLLIKCIKYKN